MKIIGRKIAGHTIEEVVWTSMDGGYILACNGQQYATWEFDIRGGDINAYFGHYFFINWDAPNRSKSKVRADLYTRAAEALARQAEYGY